MDSFVNGSPSEEIDETSNLKTLTNNVQNLAKAVAEIREQLSGTATSTTRATANAPAQVSTPVPSSGMSTVSLPNMPPQIPMEEAMGNPLLADRGIPSDNLPHIEVISPNIKAQIISGKDVNLAALLIPGFNGDIIQRTIAVGSHVYPLKPLTDTRLTKRLTLSEFVKAFSVYTAMMCSAYPQRREELNQYMSDVVDMSAQFAGFGFVRLP